MYLVADRLLKRDGFMPADFLGNGVASNLGNKYCCAPECCQLGLEFLKVLPTQGYILGKAAITMLSGFASTEVFSTSYRNDLI